METGHRYVSEIPAHQKYGCRTCLILDFIKGDLSELRPLGYSHVHDSEDLAQSPLVLCQNHSVGQSLATRKTTTVKSLTLVCCFDLGLEEGMGEAVTVEKETKTRNACYKTR